MKSFTSAVLVVSAALLCACAASKPAAAPPPDTAAIRVAVNAQLSKFVPAMKSMDAAAVASLFTDDAVWVLPDASTFRGRPVIEKAASGFFAEFDSLRPGTVTLDRLIVVNDSEAVTFSHGTFGATMKGKTPENHVNPAADYWKKGSDGIWRIAYEINADGSVPDSTATKR